MLDEQIGLPSAAREGLKVTHGIAEDRQFWSTFSVHEARPATALPNPTCCLLTSVIFAAGASLVD